MAGNVVLVEWCNTHLIKNGHIFTMFQNPHNMFGGIVVVHVWAEFEVLGTVLPVEDLTLYMYNSHA